MSHVFTIGTSNRSEGTFFGALGAFKVRHLIDVRSKPWSRLPHFSKSALTNSSARYDMTYNWSGDVLGGLNDIATDEPEFLAALDVVLALTGEGAVAVFCAEGDPAECHRSYKVGAALLVYRGMMASNILRDGREEPVTRTLLRTKADYIPPCVRDAALSASMKAAVV